MILADYYLELADHPDAARRAGWRHRIEQAYRFEAALELTSPGDVVLDIGCGPGGLADYAAAAGRKLKVVGLEVRSEAARGRSEVIIGSFLAPPPLPAFDVAVAIGTLTATPADDPTVRSLLRLASQAHCAFGVVHLDERAMTRPAIVSDPAINAVSRADWKRYAAALHGWPTTVVEITTSDSAFAATRGAAPQLRTILERFRATCHGPWGRNEPPSRRAWLAVELGLREEAEALLDGDLDELGRVVSERLGR